MIVDMYRIECADITHAGVAGDAIKQVQLSFRGSPGSLGHRLLRGLQNREEFIVVSYWSDRISHENARALHMAVDNVTRGFGAKSSAAAYEVVQEL